MLLQAMLLLALLWPPAASRSLTGSAPACSGLPAPVDGLSAWPATCKNKASCTAPCAESAGYERGFRTCTCAQGRWGTASACKRVCRPGTGGSRCESCARGFFSTGHNGTAPCLQCSTCSAGPCERLVKEVCEPTTGKCGVVYRPRGASCLSSGMSGTCSATGACQPDCQGTPDLVPGIEAWACSAASVHQGGVCTAACTAPGWTSTAKKRLTATCLGGAWHNATGPACVNADACVASPCANSTGRAQCTDLPPPAPGNTSAGRACSCLGAPRYAYQDDDAGCVCQPKTCAGDYLGTCGTGLDNGCGGSVDCSCGGATTCSATNSGELGTCVPDCQGTPDLVPGIEAWDCSAASNHHGGACTAACTAPGWTSDGMGLMATCLGGAWHNATGPACINADACVASPCANSTGRAQCTDLPPPAPGNTSAGRACSCLGAPRYAYQDDDAGCVCQSKTCAGDYLGTCGTGLDNGCGGSVDCGCGSASACNTTIAGELGACMPLLALPLQLIFDLPSIDNTTLIDVETSVVQTATDLLGVAPGDLLASVTSVQLTDVGLQVLLELAPQTIAVSDLLHSETTAGITLTVILIRSPMAKDLAVLTGTGACVAEWDGTCTPKKSDPDCTQPRDVCFVLARSTNFFGYYSPNYVWQRQVTTLMARRLSSTSNIAVEVDETILFGGGVVHNQIIDPAPVSLPMLLDPLSRGSKPGGFQTDGDALTACVQALTTDHPFVASGNPRFIVVVLGDDDDPSTHLNTTAASAAGIPVAVAADGAVGYNVTHAVQALATPGLSFLIASSRIYNQDTVAARELSLLMCRYGS